jgi:hypothetical protein
MYLPFASGFESLIPAALQSRAAMFSASARHDSRSSAGNRQPVSSWQTWRA